MILPRVPFGVELRVPFARPQGSTVLQCVKRTSGKLMRASDPSSFPRCLKNQHYQQSRPR